jgi:hypothetical protein
MGEGKRRGEGTHQRQRHEPVTTITAKQLVDDGAVGPDPGDPREPRQALEEDAGEPVPHKRAHKDIEEPLVPADGPAVGPRRVRGRVVVEGVKEGAVDEVGGPDHGRRPDQEAARQPGQPVPGAERRDAKHHLPQPAKALLVPDLLGDNHVRGIESAAAVRSLRESAHASSTSPLTQRYAHST